MSPTEHYEACIESLRILREEGPTSDESIHAIASLQKAVMSTLTAEEKDRLVTQGGIVETLAVEEDSTSKEQPLPHVYGVSSILYALMTNDDELIAKEDLVDDLVRRGYFKWVIHTMNKHSEDEFLIFGCTIALRVFCRQLSKHLWDLYAIQAIDALLGAMERFGDAGDFYFIGIDALKSCFDRVNKKVRVYMYERLLNLVWFGACEHQSDNDVQETIQSLLVRLVGREAARRMIERAAPESERKKKEDSEGQTLEMRQE